MDANPYLQDLHGALPRLLALFDADPTSAAHGVGDRRHWAWGLTDFANGTFQGAAHGLARLWRNGLWPYPTTSGRFLARIDALFAATARLVRPDGSLEEAFPREGSYCVTALVAYDLLCALDLLGPETDSATRTRWRDAIRPLAGFLVRSRETHAVISNHLATAAAALARWDALEGDGAARDRARGLVAAILAHQSAEGWFLEYDGADPGYQSLGTCYLADLHLRRPDWGLQEPLARSVRFLWHFAHPDGSFAGLYGSRCTRFYCPAGLEALAPELPEARALALFMRDSIARQRTVTLAAMDEPNLVPMFNAWCWAAALHEPAGPAPALPCRQGAVRAEFPEAGLVVDGGPDHYTVVSTRKGGVVAHFRGDRAAVMDAGVVVRRRDGALGTTQVLSPDHQVVREGDELAIRSPLWAMPRRLPSPVQFLVLRLLGITLFRLPAVREWTKRRLVRWLITRRNPWPGRNLRRIRLGPDLAVEDTLDLPPGCARVAEPGPFVPIHMASQGYWQVQDEG